MKNRNKKLLIRGVADGKTILLDSSKFYVLFILAVRRVLYEEFGFSTERLNRVTAGLAAFLDREDPATIGDELIYWAEKKGIKY